jgi:HrpA-like RNA helicase
MNINHNSKKGESNSLSSPFKKHKNNSGIISKKYDGKSGHQQDHDTLRRKSKKHAKAIKFTNGRGSDLPIFQHKEQLIESVRQHQTTVIIGETGSGKSTQLPKYLAEFFTTLNEGCVVCTQPRRVAAITVAKRVATELNVECGEEVGYAVRFDDNTTENITRIKFVTDGVLLRECMSDPNLSKYSVIILDEAHERSLNTDILMGLLKELQQKNPKLRLVVMSATLQSSIFMKFFLDTNLIHIEGRQYPVEIMYTKEPEIDYIDAAVRTVMHIHSSQPNGGILVFLPGQEDIEALMSLLKENLPQIESYESLHRNENENENGSHKKSTELLSTSSSSSKSESAPATPHNPATDGPIEVIANLYDFEIRPLYASMPPDQQLKAFAPTADPKSRKIILSTNIAETSVTINDIIYVVDTGYYKCKLLDNITGMETLKTVPVSKQQANQRSGRAGRTGPGQCYRIYPEVVYEEHLDEEALPEIQRVSISQVVLQLKTIGVKSPQHFSYLSPPSTDSLRRAMHELLLLGALDGDNADLTPFGNLMSKLPLEPMYSSLLLQSAKCADGSYIGGCIKSVNTNTNTNTNTNANNATGNGGSAASGGAGIGITPLYNCVQEMLTTVSMLSADGVYVQPSNENEKILASKKHRGLSVKSGDLPTLLNIYNSWIRARMSKDWAIQNYINQRSLQQAHNVRGQLTDILKKILFSSSNSTKLTENEKVLPSCLPEQEPYLRCLAVGLCLNVAQRVESKDVFAQQTANNMFTNKKARVPDDRHLAPYVTLRGRQPVYVHPSSVLFSLTHARTIQLQHQASKANSNGNGNGNGYGNGHNASNISTNSKNKLPLFVVFSDLLVTTKSYMRGVTKIEGDWLLGAGSSSSTSGGLFHKNEVAVVTNEQEKPKSKQQQQQQSQKKVVNMTPQALASNQGRSIGISKNAPGSKYVSQSQQNKEDKKKKKKKDKKERSNA